jgi:hypothetical protein
VCGAPRRDRLDDLEADVLAAHLLEESDRVSAADINCSAANGISASDSIPATRITRMPPAMPAA